ncbi:MAG TPA: bifunctional tRNA (5-methylaminomethyl-2-thiouridine)(34)-methyltransferase MnmD/FAD-dependent 5-carboxymethylaminomethyl-2-thiouridine(34) oxidoreductase MnmC [Burkholderiales bacterium]|nr:bifunctional tRNA (5-methylaminomethyl-2-thiouridine)(34)-methyltransferase MnmD/FAD-dependent 5-carboxymethylaminomethyl-2-thiouridine(34) oxidoreductase MnmC [Burkholderiales bacterium]
MQQPRALSPASLAFRDGTPYSAAYGDVYHSAAGGPAQARHVFLGGNSLPRRWAGRSRFVILETGFGFGLNFLATWQAWRRDPQRCARLHYVSIEKHPFMLPELQVLHGKYEFQAEAAELHARWPVLVPGAHRLELDGGRVVLTLFFGDVAIARDLRLAADAFYLDGFAPAKNPDMWSPQLLRALSRLAAAGATAATWSVASTVRHALEATGFAVEKRPGFGDKKEMLVATNVRKSESPSTPIRKAAVIGAGLAGAAVCERLCARGWEVELYERHAAPAKEASGNHAGAFHPIVTPDDSVFARLTRAAFLSSIARWATLDKLRWDPCGVLQLARDMKEEASQRASIVALALPPQYAQYVTREEASAHAGVPVTAPGLWFPQAGWIRPPSLVNALLEACGPKLNRSFSTDISKLPEAPVVILANSSGAPKLHAVPHLRLRKVRGQVTHVPASEIDAPRVVVLRGGMVLPPVEGVCVVGASYDVDDEDAAPRAESDAGNLDRLEKILGARLQISNKLQSRVAFRSVTPDRLPVAGKIGEGIYGAFAYGSRGLIWAALAAELIASELEGEPLPLEGKLADALSPGRFANRARARGSRLSRP